MERHRALWSQQAGLAEDLSGAAERHPLADTFRRVFMLIDPEAFEAGFSAWAGSLVAGFEREVVAIDGKTLRRSFDSQARARARDQATLDCGVCAAVSG